MSACAALKLFVTGVDDLNDIIVAVISLIGSACGTFGGIVTSAKLTNYRIAQLEKKVDRHNSFAERIPVLEERIEALRRRVDEFEQR